MCGPTVTPYQYAVAISADGETADLASAVLVQRHDRKMDAVEAARSWVISPLRTGPRLATVLRRRGYDGPWETVDTWKQGAIDAVG